MAMESRETIIDIKVSAKDAIDNINKFRSAQQESKKATQEAEKELKALETAIKEQGGATVEQSKRMTELKTTIETNIVAQKQYNSAISDNQKILAESINANELQGDSIKEMRKQVAALTQQWEMLSGEERAGAKGKEMQAKLADLNSGINESSISVKNFNDNIGNYRSAMDGFTSSNSLAGKALGALGVEGTKLSGIMGTNMVGAMGSLNSAMKVLSANPLMLALTALVAVLMAVWAAVEKNQAAMDALNRMMAPTKMLFEVLGKILGEVAALITGVIEKTLSFFGVTESAATQAVKIRQDLEKEEIDLITKRAKEEQRIAELQDKQTQKQVYTHKERLAMAEEIAQLRNSQVKEDEDRLKRELEAWDLEHQNMELTRKEQKERAELEAKFIAVRTNTLKVQKEQSALIDATITTINAETKALEEQQRKAAAAFEERIRLQKELVGKTAAELEDLLLNIMADGEAKELQQLETKMNRQIEAVRTRLATEQNLTVESAANLNSIITTLEEEKEIKLLEIRSKYQQERDAADVEASINKVKQEQQTADDALAKEMQRRADESALKLEQRRQELDNELLFRQENEQIYNDWLVNLDAETKSKMFETQEAYELAVLESNANLQASEQAVAEDMQQQAIMRVQAVASIAGSLSSMISTLADKSKAGAVFAKSLALVEIMTNMGIGIAAAIKSGAGVPFPGNLVAIATGVATVASGIANAKSALSSSSMPMKPAILGSSSVGASSTPSVASTTGISTSSIANELGAIESRAEQQQALTATTAAPVVKVVDIIDAIDSVSVKEAI